MFSIINILHILKEVLIWEKITAVITKNNQNLQFYTKIFIFFWKGELRFKLHYYYK
jgi:hypothetical protein